MGSQVSRVLRVARVPSPLSAVSGVSPHSLPAHILMTCQQRISFDALPTTATCLHPLIKVRYNLSSIRTGSNWRIFQEHKSHHARHISEVEDPHQSLSHSHRQLCVQTSLVTISDNMKIVVTFSPDFLGAYRR